MSKICKSTWTIVRHGETFENEMGIIQGQSVPAKLNSKGIAQAEQLGTFFKENSQEFDVIMCSDLIRTRMTTDSIVGKMHETEQSGPNPKQHNAILVSHLRERCFGELEGKHRDARNLLKSDPKGAETQGELKARIREFTTKFLQQLNGNIKGNTEVLLVSHGGTIREWIRSLQADFAEGFEKVDISGIPPNSSKTVLEFSWERSDERTANKRMKNQLPAFKGLTCECKVLYNVDHLEETIVELAEPV